MQDYKKHLPKVIALIVFIISSTITGSIVKDFFKEDNLSKEEIIKIGVDSVNEKFASNREIDEYTTIEEATAEEGAIRYHYYLHDADLSSMTNEILRNNVQNALCDNEKTAALLKKDINMEYSYSTDVPGTSYFFSISRADCNI